MTATASKNGHIDKDEVLSHLSPQVVATIYERIAGPNHRAAGEWRKCPSPFYTDSSENPGFNWHPITGHYKDHSKDESGDIFGFVMRAERCSFPDAVAYVANIVGYVPRSAPAVKGSLGTPVATYDYRDETNTLLYQTVRYDPKDFRQRQPKPGGGWEWNLKDVRRVLYRLPELRDASPIEDVLIPAGEKDADRAISEGFVATTNPMGEGNWIHGLGEPLRGRHVVLIPDNDDKGREHVQKVAQDLLGVAETIKVVTLPGVPEKGDLSDWFNAGGTAAELKRLIMSTPEWQPASEDIAELLDEPIEPARTPRFTLVTPSQLKQRPAPEWMIDGIMLEDSLSAIIGGPGTFKSFVAISQALSIAGGHPWNGHSVRQGPVVYISAEGSKGVPKRIAAWENYHGRTASEECYFITDAVQFMESGDVEELLYAIGLLPVQPVFVVVDTLARTMLGYEENSSKDMGVYIAGADRIRSATGANVCLLHHVNKNGDTRGSTALPGALDTIIEVKRDDDIVTLSCGKQKDSEEFSSFHLIRRIVEVADMDTSLVLIPSDQSSVGMSANDRKVKAILVDVFGDAGATASQWEKACGESGIAHTTFFRSRKNLIQAGEVTADKEGRGARYQPARFGMEDDGDVF